MVKKASHLYHEIIPHLFLGNQLATFNAEHLKIDVIISIGAQSKNNNIQNIHFSLRDDKTLIIENELTTITNLIHELLESNKRILIHCKSGINRAPSFVLAYLCMYKNMTINEGIDYIKSLRSICKFSFKKHVQDWMEKKT